MFGSEERSTTPLEHLIPVGATLWSQQAPKAQPKAPPAGSREAASAGAAAGLPLQAGTWQQKPAETFVNMPTSSPNAPAAPSLTPCRAAV